MGENDLFCLVAFGIYAAMLIGLAILLREAGTSGMTTSAQQLFQMLREARRWDERGLAFLLAASLGWKRGYFACLGTAAAGITVPAAICDILDIPVVLQFLLDLARSLRAGEA